jgi:hypothetical protein
MIRAELLVLSRERFTPFNSLRDSHNLRNLTHLRWLGTYLRKLS